MRSERNAPDREILVGQSKNKKKSMASRINEKKWFRHRSTVCNRNDAITLQLPMIAFENTSISGWQMKDVKRNYTVHSNNIVLFSG